MPGDRSSRLTRGGSATADRLSARAGNGRGRPDGGLRSVAGAGSDVLSGELATRALQALGARAMTVDRTILVPDGFDASRPEDKALLEHEKVHLEMSGGLGENSGRDHEEVAARAKERSMILHMGGGGMESHDAAHTGGASAGGTPGGVAHSSGGSAVDKTENESVRGYLALKKRGLSHEDIVALLAKEVISGMHDQREQSAHRMADKKGFT